MTPAARRGASRPATEPALTIGEPADLIEVIPYLLGFQPVQSLTIVGLRKGEVTMTARSDLDAIPVGDLALAIGRSGATHAVSVIYSDGEPFSAWSVVGHQPLPHAHLIFELEQALGEAGMLLAGAMLVSGRRYFNYLCQSACCPPEGNRLPAGTTSTAAQATYAGMVIMPDRAEVGRLLDPLPSSTSTAMREQVVTAESDAVAQILAGRQESYLRSVKRAIFAAARRVDDSSPEAPVSFDDQTLCRFGVALADIGVRDALWQALEDRRLEASELWLELGRRLPAPYRAAPLFLYGWGRWRAGNGTLARFAAEQVLSRDPDYSAADLLIRVLDNAMDPRTTPRLNGRSASSSTEGRRSA